MSGWLWFVIGFGALTIFVLLFFTGVALKNRAHDEATRRRRLDAEEDRIRDDIREMRRWYAEQTARKNAEDQAFLAEL